MTCRGGVPCPSKNQVPYLQLPGTKLHSLSRPACTLAEHVILPRSGDILRFNVSSLPCLFYLYINPHLFYTFDPTDPTPRKNAYIVRVSMLFVSIPDLDRTERKIEKQILKTPLMASKQYAPFTDRPPKARLERPRLLS